MKKSIAIVLISASLCCLFVGCKKAPKEEITTNITKVSHVDESDAAVLTRTAEEEASYLEMMSSIKAREASNVNTEVSVESESKQRGASEKSTEAGYDISKDPQYMNYYDFKYENFNVYHNSYASIQGFEFEDYGTAKVVCKVSVKLDGIGTGEKDFKIGYTQYYEDGTVAAESYLLIPVSKMKLKEGDIFKARMDINNYSRDVDKVEFYNYVEK